MKGTRVSEIGRMVVGLACFVAMVATLSGCAGNSQVTGYDQGGERDRGQDVRYEYGADPSGQADIGTADNTDSARWSIPDADSACAYVRDWLIRTGREVPAYIECDHVSARGYTIHGYNIVGDHTGTLFWYTVDSTGGIYDEVLSQYVDTSSVAGQQDYSVSSAPSDCSYATPLYTVSVPSSWSGAVNWRYDDSTFNFEGLATMGHELRVSNVNTGESFLVSAGTPEVILQGDYHQAPVGSAVYEGKVWQIIVYADAQSVGADGIYQYAGWVFPTGE